MKRVLSLIALLLLYIGAAAQGFSFAAADTMGTGVVKTGTVNVPIPSHYYKIVLPGNGIIKLATTTSNGGLTDAWTRYWVYYKNQTYITYKDAHRLSGATGNDTLTISGVAGDTLYVRVDNWSGGQSTFYSMHYYMLGVQTNTEAQANESFATAGLLPRNATVSGNVGFYSVTSGVDYNDYYKIVLPKHATLKLYTTATFLAAGNGSGPLPRIYLYNKSANGEGIAHLGGSAASFFNIANQWNTPYLIPYNDTFYSYARADDTMYVLMYNDNASSYTLRWDILDTATYTETEPNGTMATAPILPQGATVEGDISYKSGGGVDVDDYYRIILNKAGTVNIYATATNTYGFDATSPAPVIYVYNKAAFPQQVRSATGNVSGAMRLRNNGTVPFLTSLTDTLTVSGLANDTFYVAVYNYHTGAGYTWAAQYKLRYTLTDTANNETEPNDTRQQAQLIAEGQQVHGHANYSTGTATDIEDYFKIVKPQRGTIRLYVTSKNTAYINATSPALELFAFSKAGNPLSLKSSTGATGTNIHVRNNGAVPIDGVVTDTVLIECVADDTMYIKVENYFNFQYGGNATAYDLRYEYLPPAEAEMVVARTGNEFGFTNLSTNANSYLWLMGNGNQYTSYYPPMTSYTPGFYEVQLIAKNTTCNYNDTAKTSFTIAGIEDYMPKKGGAGGDVLLQVYGGGLDTGTQVRFIKGATVLTPARKFSSGKENHFTAVMDLHFSDTGWYDVEITVPSQSPVTYTNGFHVEGLIYPYAWSQVVAPWAWRINTDNTFKLVVGNRGNVMASGVVVAMLWPKTTQLTWNARFDKPDYTQFDTMQINTGTFAIPNTVYQYIYDSLNTVVPIDSFNGQPYDGYAQYLTIPHIPANGTIEIPFKARASANGLQQFITYTHRPNMFGSCNTQNFNELHDNAQLEMMDATDGLSSQNQWDNVYDYINNSNLRNTISQEQADAASPQFLGFLTDLTPIAIPVQDFAKNSAATVEGIFQGIERDAAAAAQQRQQQRQRTQEQVEQMMQETIEHREGKVEKSNKAMLDYLKANNHTTPNYDRTANIDFMFDNQSNMQSIQHRRQRLDEQLAFCPNLDKQKEDLEENLNDHLTRFEPRPTPTASVTSFDPNAIYGPSGIDVPKYISNFQRQPFLITFENVDTATADAQDVIIRDTIDKTKFDIHSISFGDVVVANQIIRVPMNRNQFVVESRLDSIPGMYVRINGLVDTGAGVITWHFSSIDSATMNKPLLHGFLKPNVNKPEGESSVSYAINPLTTVPDATVFTSKATIIFDENEPIVTAEWANKMDIVAPTSAIASGTLTNDTVITLQMTGADASSGVSNYIVYVSTNNGPWHTLGRTSLGEMSIVGQHDSTYSFYCVAEDNVGNKEVKATAQEYTITIPTNVLGLNARGATCNVYPNPASNEVFIDVALTTADHVDVQLQSVTGQNMMNIYSGRVDGKTTLNASLRQVPAGVYFVVLTTKSGIRQTAKLVVTQ